MFLLFLLFGSAVSVFLNCNVVFASSRPVVPEFTVEVVDSSYYVPPTFKIDKYTGENVTVEQGHTVERVSIYVKIKNQPFASYGNGTRYYMAYNTAYKGHFGEEWESLDFDRTRTMKSYRSDDFPKPSNSEYTVLRVCSSRNFPENTQLDIKVQALIGHEAVIHIIDYLPDHCFPVYAGEHDEDGIIFDTAGEWSDIQTVTVNLKDNLVVAESEITDDEQTFESPTDSQEQITFGLIGLAVIVAALVVGVFVYYKKQKD